MFNFLILLAEEAPKGAEPSPAFNWLLPLGILFIFYFVLWRPMRRQDQERTALLKSLKKNDKVITAGGIYGTVVSVAEQEDEVVVKVDDNVRVRMTKGSIARNLTNEEAARAAKAPKEGAA